MRGKFWSPTEDEILYNLHKKQGLGWTAIEKSGKLPGMFSIGSIVNLFDWHSQFSHLSYIQAGIQHPLQPGGRSGLRRGMIVL